MEKRFLQSRMIRKSDFGLEMRLSKVESSQKVIATLYFCLRESW